MKALKHQATISTISAKVDGSVGYRVNTPELTNDEKTAIFSMQNQNLEILISPLGAKEVIEVKTDLNQKSQSQRIRSVIYLLWEQKPEGMTFEQYYQNKTEKYIEHLKGLIEQ
jgi:hypothetical protein